MSIWESKINTVTECINTIVSDLAGQGDVINHRKSLPKRLFSNNNDLGSKKIEINVCRGLMQEKRIEIKCNKEAMWQKKTTQKK